MQQFASIHYSVLAQSPGEYRDSVRIRRRSSVFVRVTMYNRTALPHTSVSCASLSVSSKSLLQLNQTPSLI